MLHSDQRGLESVRNMKVGQIKERSRPPLSIVRGRGPVGHDYIGRAVGARVGPGRAQLYR